MSRPTGEEAGPKDAERDRRSVFKVALGVAAVGCFLLNRHIQRERRRAREETPSTYAISRNPLPAEAWPQASVPIVPDDLARLLPPDAERVYLPRVQDWPSMPDAFRQPLPGDVLKQGGVGPVEIIRRY